MSLNRLQAIFANVSGIANRLLEPHDITQLTLETHKLAREAQMLAAEAIDLRQDLDSLRRAFELEH